MNEKPTRSTKAKPRMPAAETIAPDAMPEEPELAVIVDENTPPPPSSATVTVNAKCRWNSVQSAGMWFTKRKGETVNINDERLPEWQANPFLIVEV